MRHKTFRNNDQSYEMEFVETNAFRQLLDLTNSGRSPIVMTGPGGSGKTSNLYLLLKHLENSNRTGILIQSSTIRGETDLINEIRDQLEEDVESALASVQIGSSSDVASDIVAKLIDSLETPPIMIFDEVDHATVQESNTIRIIIGEIQRSTRATLILSGRTVPHWFTSELTRVYEIHLKAFDQAEITEMLLKNDVSEDRVTSFPALMRLTGGNPLIVALVLDLMRSNQLSWEEVLDLQDNTSKQLAERLLAQEMQRFDYLGNNAPSKENFATLLSALVLREKLAISELPFLEEALNKMIDVSSLVVRDGSFVRLAHTSMSEILRESLGLNSPHDLKVSDLTFGMEEAERDNLLEDNFLPPRGVSEIKSGKTTIVIGDRGSGKSALYSHLTNTTQEGEKATLIIAMHDPRGLIEKMGTEGKKLDTTEEFREAWRLCVAVSIAESKEISGPLFQSETAKALRSTFGEDHAESKNWWTPLHNLLRSSKFKFSLGPVSIDADPLNGKGSNGKNISVDGFLNSVAAQLSGKSAKLILAVDRVDEIHKYDRSRQEKLIQGLFQAEAEMSQSPNISLLVFIRSDLFHVYSIEEKNKTVSRKLNLEWDEQQLLKMMLHRVFSSELLSDLRDKLVSLSDFDSSGLQVSFPEMVESMPFVDWLWSSLRNGRGQISPRQIILLLILCRQTPEASHKTVDGLPLISSTILRSAMTKLSEISFEEMTDDFRVAPNFLRNCRAAKLDELSLSEIEDLFIEADGDMNLCIEHLERLGFFERSVRKEGGKKRTYHFRVPKLYTRAWADEAK